MKLKNDFFNRDALLVGKELIGQYLINDSNEGKVVGRIVETESYCGTDDLASHASKDKSKRSKPMFGPAGHFYIYLNYGIFYMTNIVCDRVDYPAAILLRAVEIIEGQGIAAKRLRQSKFVKENKFLATGPGKLSIAFDISKSENDLDITKSADFYFEKNPKSILKSDIIKATRVGVDYAKHCKEYPWRFYLCNNEYVSKQQKSIG